MGVGNQLHSDAHGSTWDTSRRGIFRGYFALWEVDHREIPSVCSILRTERPESPPCDSDGIPSVFEPWKDGRVPKPLARNIAKMIESWTPGPSGSQLLR